MTFADIVARIIDLVLNPLVALLIGVALIFFLWGVVKLISSGGDAGKRAEGVSMITYGVIALFVMVAVWGLVGIVASTLNIGTSGVPSIVP